VFNPIARSTRLVPVLFSTAENLRHGINRVPLIALDSVRLNCERNARVCVAEILRNVGGGHAWAKQQTCMRVPQLVEVHIRAALRRWCKACQSASTLVGVPAEAIKRQGPFIPLAYPHHAVSREAGSGQTIAGIFKVHGVNTLPERATFPDGGYSVEAGLLEMTERMQTGRFKVLSHLREWFEEFQLYHRKNGQLVKLQDDLISATRYALMMQRYAKVDSGSVSRGTPRIAHGLDYDFFNRDESGGSRGGGGAVWGNGRPPSLR
jgi:hypothetical protein